jgi:hypothetical protein
MCNACGFYCCGYDVFDGCGCDCPELSCRMVRCEICGASTDPHDGYYCDACEEDQS